MPALARSYYPPRSDMPVTQCTTTTKCISVINLVLVVHINFKFKIEYVVVQRGGKLRRHCPKTSGPHTITPVSQCMH